jgi:arsenate reductase-like glutaredoxin family protein
MDQIKLIERNDDRFSVHLFAKIDESGDLVLEGQDLGSGVEEYWGDSDYEYWVIVKARYKLDTFLKLAQYTFNTIGKFVDWLDNLGIEYKKVKSTYNEQNIVAEADSNKIEFKIHTGGLGIKKLDTIITLDRIHEDKLLLLLLKHTFECGLFSNDAKFIEWLKRHGIEYLFHSYV